MKIKNQLGKLHRVEESENMEKSNCVQCSSNVQYEAPEPDFHITNNNKYIHMPVP